MEMTSKQQAIKALSKFGSVLQDKAKPGEPVIEVALGGAMDCVKDDILTHLECFPELENLLLNQTFVTDKVLEALRTCSNLKQLVIDETQVTDSGLRNLCYCHVLESLILGDRVTDLGLDSIIGVSSLKYLDISGTAISANAITRIQALANLEFLAVVASQVTPESARAFGVLPKLNTIHIIRSEQARNPSCADLRKMLPHVTVEEY